MQSTSQSATSPLSITTMMRVRLKRTTGLLTSMPRICRTTLCVATVSQSRDRIRQTRLLRFIVRTLADSYLFLTLQRIISSSTQLTSIIVKIITIACTMATMIAITTPLLRRDKRHKLAFRRRLRNASMFIIMRGRQALEAGKSRLSRNRTVEQSDMDRFRRTGTR